MAKQKLKWTDAEEIAFRLIDQYPSMDPLKVRFTDLHRYITSLPDFSDSPKKSNEKILEDIQMRWYEERKDMEDELGPVVTQAEDEDLDEDNYRDDEMVEEEGLPAEDDEDDDGYGDDEFGDGFQEEEADDER